MNRGFQVFRHWERDESGIPNHHRSELMNQRCSILRLSKQEYCAVYVLSRMHARSYELVHLIGPIDLRGGHRGSPLEEANDVWASPVMIVRVHSRVAAGGEEAVAKVGHSELQLRDVYAYQVDPVGLG